MLYCVQKHFHQHFIYFSCQDYEIGILVFIWQKGPEEKYVSEVGNKLSQVTQMVHGGWIWNSELGFLTERTLPFLPQ